MDDEIINARHCRVCNLHHDDDDPVHNNSALHRFNFLLFEWSKYRKALVKNRHGIIVTVDLRRRNGYNYNYITNYNKGKHCLKVTPETSLSHDNTFEFQCTVKNTRKDSIYLTSAILLHCYPLFSLYDPNNNVENNRVCELRSGAVYTVIVKFSSGDNVVIGGYKIPVSFSFQTISEKVDTFTIARSINISVEEESAEENQSEKSPFKGNEWRNVTTIPPTRNQRYPARYLIPPDYKRFMKYGLQEFPSMSGIDYQVLTELRQQIYPNHVTFNNYQQFWHIILWLEEMGQTLGLQRYNMENVTLKLKERNMLELVVPGLAEKRPSVIVGDLIDLRVHEDHTAYRGFIKSVNDKTVDISDVDEELIDVIRLTPTIEIDVQFVLGRLPLERMHQGVDQVVSKGLVSALFPSVKLRKRVVPQLRTISNGEFYNEMIVTNPEQKTAVLKILNASSCSAPYIVFGPPGTGKTITIVEAILQIKKKTQSTILVCAPANAACNMLTEKLMLHCRKDEMIRIMSENVDTSAINENILEYTNYVEKGAFRKVTTDELKKYRIVITTLILVGRYTGSYHPDVLFVDEAAQACEPEVDCAIGMMDKGKQIVLAGDPRQLGPSLSSRVAMRYGLGISLLERLMDLELYESKDPNYITMLRQNFRSHSTILKLPNQLFYDGQLQAAAPRSENDPIAKIFVYERIQGIYKKTKGKTSKPTGEAIEFCNVISKECRQGRSPSYFNQKEMQMVLKYVQALISLEFENEEDKVTPEQIGVVTPYIRQVYKVREILKQNHLEGVEVGTTETFQGREKRIILITTVRAQKDLLLHDKQYNLGFVRHDKRFNVALTRAMSKLIVIGCSHVLGSDEKWLGYIELCENLDGFCGVPFARRTGDVINDITNRFRNVKMIDSQNNH
ncbi:hypothetical protein JTB14_007047 [Gonioctena quinquepunctata]|nr:hypothetical protein JTB14_007047 [Gonioctena quinquepunctata]